MRKIPLNKVLIAIGGCCAQLELRVSLSWLKIAQKLYFLENFTFLDLEIPVLNLLREC